LGERKQRDNSPAHDGLIFGEQNLDHATAARFREHAQDGRGIKRAAPRA